MTQSLAINARNDLFIGDDGSLALVTGVYAVELACKTIVRTMLGELQFEQDQVTPNFTEVWVGGPRLAQFEAYFRQMVGSRQDVTGIPSFEMSVADGVLAYTAVIETIYGELSING